jgi:hypothetical protein
VAAEAVTRVRTGPALILLVLGAMALAAEPAACAPAFDRNHAMLDALLAAHVAGGRVDYAGLSRQPQPLDDYLVMLAMLPAAELKALPRNDQLAFWINAYNAFVLKSVVEHFPLQRRSLVGLAFPANSIWQIAGVWKDPRWNAAGTLVSLDQIEHEIIRPRFNEPRAHFALVCASTSCPDLLEQAYRGDAIDRQLSDRTRRFLQDPGKGVRIDVAGGSVRISKIFDWFEEDFAGGAPAFIAGHLMDPKLRAVLLDPRIEVEFLDYDWTLNDRARP